MKKTTYNAKLTALAKATRLAEKNEGERYGVSKHGRKFIVHPLYDHVDKRYRLTNVVQRGYVFHRKGSIWKGTPHNRLYYPESIVQ